jgi:GNAT superfamily N-acetyltransferase
VSIAVRDATPDDDAFISELGSSSAVSSGSPIRPVGPSVAAESFLHLLSFCRERSGTITLVARVGPDRAGFLILLTDVADDVTRQGQGFVAYMAVADRYRRRGVARALLHAAETRAADERLPHLSLLVSTDNVPARSLYEAEGFLEERAVMTKPVGKAAVR